MPSPGRWSVPAPFPRPGLSVSWCGGAFLCYHLLLQLRAGRMRSSTVLHWRRKWRPTPYSCWEIPWTEEPGELQTTGSQSRTRLFFESESKLGLQLLYSD